MTSPVRRTIQELVMRYRLEPGLQDVYVEGVFDRDVYTSALIGGAPHDLTIYPIECVEVTSEDLEECGLSDGNKQRVIALALKLACISEHANYLCLVDRDLDHWFAKHPLVQRLKWTRYCSIESHFITADTFQEIAILAGKVKVPNPAELFYSIIEALKSLYALRLADRELDLRMAWVPLKRYLTQEESSISLDYHSYVNALLNKNGRMADKDTFLDSAKRWAGQFSNEHRLCIRGHDFTELLAWVVNKFNGVAGFGNPEVISRAFVIAAKGNTDIAQELCAIN